MHVMSASNDEGKADDHGAGSIPAAGSVVFASAPVHVRALLVAAECILEVGAGDRITAAAGT